ncbi:1-aminocyclopropane-1-carboxylate deaminase/D-cysteine desulfhydrase [Roseivirga misakiensis]|uniref:1-aminocyclopropane-1-carboxylate deaminase n=1 Tax=Roseivirga misakiensis TaxID=1563681 RepID=A0A1E5T6M3_9BACT|nr:pyridoxal-phosphate dependent enzyme [Roseivirga misakiensis]OEK07044.1 1-aminocyclopropane-1-carboxylate deaminase [Roseivirga misakiensis]
MEISPAPVQQIHEPLFEQKGVQVFIKREDLTHPVVSGNKWRKLKYNLQAAKEQQHDTLLTFGGAYSNHIHAVAGAGKAFGFKTIGIIRGEETLPLNHTLTYAKSCGMELRYMDRATYRLKNSLEVKHNLLSAFGKFYLIPEGGTNALAIKGCEEIVEDLSETYDYYTLGVGTGGTISGLIASLKGLNQVIGFSSLKGDFLTQEVENLLVDYNGREYKNWQINNDFHFGGYAKIKPEFLSFIKSFEDQHGILLDPVYTGKSLYGLYQLINKDYFGRGTRILFIHTGGLQGRSGFGI